MLEFFVEVRVSLEKYRFEVTQISPEKEDRRAGKTRSEQNQSVFLATLCFGSVKEMTSQHSSENHAFMVYFCFNLSAMNMSEETAE